jgi:hypothetical protein
VALQPDLEVLPAAQPAFVLLQQHLHLAHLRGGRAGRGSGSGSARSRGHGAPLPCGPAPIPSRACAPVSACWQAAPSPHAAPPRSEAPLQQRPGRCRRAPRRRCCPPPSCPTRAPA